MSKLIPLHGIRGTGQFAIVDDDDYPMLSLTRWSMNGRGYAFGADGKGGTTSIHRLLMNPPQGMQVDHINHDKLDNRRENLRICTGQENANNKIRIQHPIRPNKAGYKGVKRSYKLKKPWRAIITIKKKLIHIGHYETKEEAARAYDEAAIKAYGDKAVLNFDNKPST